MNFVAKLRGFIGVVMVAGIGVVLVFAVSLLPVDFAEAGLRERMKERWGKKSGTQAEAGGEAPLTKAGDYAFAFEHAGRTRRYLVHVPAKYDPAKATPVLFAFHGGGGSMEYQADDSKYKLISKSEDAGFIAVFPNGFSRLKSGLLATWNAGKCCAAARDQNVDDVGFVKEIVARLTRQLNIDQKKIFATGMSNGAMMAYRLACELPDTFAAIAAVAGTDNTKECAPKKIPSILHIHAKNDDHVLFQGGAGPKAQKQAIVSDFTSVPATIEKWVKLAGCDPAPKRVLSVAGAAGASCDLYKCRDDARVQLCVTETGGHSWPGGIKSRGNERPSNAISANDVMWDFFLSKKSE